MAGGKTDSGNHSFNREVGGSNPPAPTLLSQEKTRANKEKEFEPEGLGEIVTKILAFQFQFKVVASKLDSIVDGLIHVLKDHGISLPDN